MRRRPIAKRPEAAQKRELLRPEPGDIDKGLGPGQHCEPRQQKHLVERIHHLAALARVRQIVKIAQKNNGFSKGPTIRHGVHPRTPPSNQKGLDGFRASRPCHPLLRPIALMGSWNGSRECSCVVSYPRSEPFCMTWPGSGTRSNSHAVAARGSGTTIPLASGEGSGGQDHYPLANQCGVAAVNFNKGSTQNPKRKSVSSASNAGRTPLLREEGLFSYKDFPSPSVEEGARRALDAVYRV